jgi:iron complex outermembrane recepter protein
MTSSSLPLRRAVTLALAISGAMASGYAFSADEANAGSSAPELEEIIVTAEKRSENLQDVPISIIAVSSQQLKDAGVKDIKDLQALTPGLTVTSDTSEATTVARIRGIGTVGDNPGLESSVGIVIDGVYRPRNGVGFGDLGELEQVEILEGPQGVQFGKNNDAGVINITTKRPSQTFEATGEITGGNFNDREISASVTGGLSDTVAARVFVEYQRRDGWLQLDNGLGPLSQNSTDDRNVWVARTQLLFTPTSNIDFLLIADVSKRDESCCGAVPLVTGPFEGLVNAVATNPLLGGNGGANGSGISLTPTQYTAWANVPIVQTVRDYGFSGELNWNFDWAKLTSITAWRDDTQGGGNDFDYTGIDILESPPTAFNRTDFKQFSEELRLAGKTGPVQWLAGFFYARESLSPNGQLFAGSNWETYLSGVASASIGAPNFGLISGLTGKAPGTTLTTADGYQDSYFQRENTEAFFTNETWTIVEGLDLTAGLRYTREDKSANSNYHNTDPPGTGCAAIFGPSLIEATGNEQKFLLGYGCYTGYDFLFNGVQTNQSLTENNLSGVGKLSYRFTPDLMAYGSWSDGFKAGGFNLSRTTFPAGTGPTTFLGTSVPFEQLAGMVPNLNTGFPAEKVQSFELGLKSTWFEKTLRLNGALFDERFKDFQLNTFTGIQFVVTSLPNVSSKGGDLDLAWVTPLSGLTFSGGVTYAYTNIDNFGSALGFFDPQGVGGVGNGGPPRLNNRISFAPVWSAAGSLMYVVPLPNALQVRFVVDEKYNTSYNTGSDLNPQKLQGGYGIMDARIGFGPQDGRWTLEAWSQNLLNKFYYQVAFDDPFQFNEIALFPAAPRFWGITAKVRF